MGQLTDGAAAGQTEKRGERSSNRAVLAGADGSSAGQVVFLVLSLAVCCAGGEDVCDDETSVWEDETARAGARLMTETRQAQAAEGRLMDLAR